MRPAQQVEIPATTLECYITGLYALNIQEPDGEGGDWHDVFHWQEGYENQPEVTLAGSPEIDTVPIYGHLGVYEGRQQLTTQGLTINPAITEVYLADHTRAILDLLYQSLARTGHVYNLTGATTDWLETHQRGQLVLQQAARMAPRFPEAAQAELQRWISSERQQLKAVYG